MCDQDTANAVKQTEPFLRIALTPTSKRNPCRRYRSFGLRGIALCVHADHIGNIRRIDVLERSYSIDPSATHVVLFDRHGCSNHVANMASMSFRPKSVCALPSSNTTFMW